MTGAVVVYRRVSTAEQAEHGVSLEAQDARARAWAQAAGREVRGVFTDAGISGKRADNRPELQAALASLQRGDALVVYSLSRLSRSLRDTLAISDALRERGADLVSLSESIDTTSAAGKMFFHMLAVLSQFERDIISERTRMALDYKRARGEKLGGPVPYRLGTDREREAHAEALRLRASGLTLRAIGSELLTRGYRPRSAPAWSATVVRRMLGEANQAS